MILLITKYYQGRFSDFFVVAGGVSLGGPACGEGNSSTSIVSILLNIFKNNKNQIFPPLL